MGSFIETLIVALGCLIILGFWLFIMDLILSPLPDDPADSEDMNPHSV